MSPHTSHRRRPRAKLVAAVSVTALAVVPLLASAAAPAGAAAQARARHAVAHHATAHHATAHHATAHHLTAPHATAMARLAQHGAQRANALRAADLTRIFGAGPTVVTSGLNNPRQLSLTAGDGALLVAEAGRGGPACTSGGPEGETCIGATGSVTAVVAPQFARARTPLRVVQGLLSGASPDGSGAVGPDGVSARTLAAISIAETYAPLDVLPQGLPGEQAGHLLRARAFGSAVPVADLAAYEAAHDPDGQGFDSNPYAALVLPHRVLVTDAAANDVLAVDDAGRISTLAVLPQITDGACAGQPNDGTAVGCDPVPTSLAVGPDGSVYVGGLGGEAPGAGRVWRLDPRTGAIEQTWTGLTTVTGVAVGRDGSLYVSELFGGSGPGVPGDLLRISTSGDRTAIPVPFPAGAAVDRFDNVYVSAFSIAPATGLGFPDSSGQVWRLRF